MQKTYTTDFLEHTHKKNNGELAQYYADNTHPTIIGQGISKEGKESVHRILETALLHQSSSARIAEVSMVRRYGTRQTNTEELFTNAIRSLIRAIQSAKHPSSQKMR